MLVLVGLVLYTWVMRYVVFMLTVSGKVGELAAISVLLKPPIFFMMT